MDNRLIEKIAYELYLIRRKRNEGNDPALDWLTACRIVDHFQFPDRSNFIWRYRDQDYERFAELYEVANARNGQGARDTKDNGASRPKKDGASDERDTRSYV